MHEYERICSEAQQKILYASGTDTNETECNCTRIPCPLPGAEVGKNCRAKEVIYRAVIKTNNEQNLDNCRYYTGGTEQQLKDRVAFHRSCNLHERLEKSSELSKEIHRLRRAGETFEIKWSILEKSRKFRAGEKYCRLCIAEMYHIPFESNERSLNGLKLEACLHKRKAMLNNVPVPG